MIKTDLHASHITRKNIGLEHIICTRFSNRKKDSRLNVVYSNKFFCVIIWLQKLPRRLFFYFLVKYTVVFKVESKKVAQLLHVHHKTFKCNTIIHM